MQEMLSPPAPSWAWGWATSGIDHRWTLFSGGTRGACIGHVSPEAAARGPIAALRNGDRIEIDLHARRLEVDLTRPRFENAAGGAAPLPAPHVPAKWLRRYSHFVTSADTRRGAERNGCLQPNKRLSSFFANGGEDE
jgi:dihydroxy-acid dehydratase